MEKLLIVEYEKWRAEKKRTLNLALCEYSGKCEIAKIRDCVLADINQYCTIAQNFKLHEKN